MGISYTTPQPHLEIAPRVVEEFYVRLVRKTYDEKTVHINKLIPDETHIEKLLERSTLPLTARTPDRDIVIEVVEHSVDGTLRMLVSARNGITYQQIQKALTRVKLVSTIEEEIALMIVENPWDYHSFAQPHGLQSPREWKEEETDGNSIS